VKKWADIGHGFLVDPVSPNYTKNDFNLLSNSKFRAGQPDAYEKGDLKGVHAAVEADATLFEWWFHKNPPSEFPPYEEPPSNPLPALSYPLLGTQTADGSTRPVLFKILNKPSDNNYEKIGIEVTIDGKALSLDSPYETSQFTVPFIRVFAYCYVRMGYPNAGYSISSTRKLINARFVGLLGSSKIYGPWTRSTYLFTGVETHPGQAQGWVCYR
jgi:hypothetical protein